MKLRPTTSPRIVSWASPGAFCSLLLLIPGQAEAADSSNSSPSDLSSHSSRIYGGKITKVCEFPTTVAGRDACTGTLVHPRVVLSAAHCGRHRQFLIGEYKSKAAKKVKPKWCEMSSSSGSDAQICVLEEAIEGLPLAPIIQGCEAEALKKGGKVLLSGFGYDENDPVGNGSIRDEKRWVETKITRITKTEVHIGGGGKGACNGDSGGPAFLQLEDGTWRTIGATHATVTGGAHPNCDIASWKRTDVLMPWYEKQLKKHGENDIDLSPCFNDQGKWEPTKDCGGYTKDVQGPHGAWSNNCGEGVPSLKYSATCGPAYSNKDNEAPKVEIVKPSSDFKLSEDEPLNVEVDASDDDKVAKVTLRIDDEVIGSKSKAPYKWTVEDLEAGLHKLQASAEDNDGVESKSQTINIEVEALDEDSSEDSGNNGKKGKDGKGDKNGKGGKKGKDGGDEDEDDDSAEDSSNEDDSGPAGSGGSAKNGGDGIDPDLPSQSPSPKPKRGCQIAAPSPANAAFLGGLLPGLALLIRRRRRHSPS